MYLGVSSKITLDLSLSSITHRKYNLSSSNNCNANLKRSTSNLYSTLKCTYVGFWLTLLTILTVQNHSSPCNNYFKIHIVRIDLYNRKCTKKSSEKVRNDHLSLYFWNCNSVEVLISLMATLWYFCIWYLSSNKMLVHYSFDHLWQTISLESLFTLRTA
jgi:hypothetical protein